MHEMRCGHVRCGLWGERLRDMFGWDVRGAGIDDVHELRCRRHLSELRRICVHGMHRRHVRHWWIVGVLELRCRRVFRSFRGRVHDVRSGHFPIPDRRNFVHELRGRDVQLGDGLGVDRCVHELQRRDVLERVGSYCDFDVHELRRRHVFASGGVGLH